VDALAGIGNVEQRARSLGYVGRYGSEEASVRAVDYLAGIEDEEQRARSLSELVPELRAYFEDNQ
jgi:hypothetical protein